MSRITNNAISPTDRKHRTARLALRSCHIDPLEPRRLLSSAIDAVSGPIPPIVIDPFPEIVVTTPPSSGAVVRAPSLYMIQWETTGRLGLFPTVNLYYDSDNAPGGETPIPGATDLPITGVFAWNVPADLIGQQVYIKAVAGDGRLSAYDYSDGKLSIRRPSSLPTLSISDIPRSYIAGGPALLIDPSVTLTDSDSSNFDGGILTVTLTNGALNDRLGIRNEGRAPGQIAFADNVVFYSGVSIGTVIGGKQFTSLVVMLNANATVEATQALLRNLTFYNPSASVSGTTRTIRYALVDGAGGLSAILDRDVDIIHAVLQPTNYALLFAGGCKAEKNHVRYYNNTKTLYQTLINQYGLTPDNIYILYADGTNPAADQNPDNGSAYINSDMSFASGAHVMAATHDNLDYALNELANRVTSSDYFFFWSFDHGGGTQGQSSATGEECLCGFGSNISDEELASWLNNINGAHSTYVMTQCFSGGMQDNIQPNLTAGEFSCAATNHYEFSYSDAFASAFTSALLQGYRMSSDAYEYAYRHDGYATGGEGPYGTPKDGVEHPWSVGDNFRIFYPRSNAAPAIGSSFLYATSKTNSAIVFTYDQLQFATQAHDPDGDQVDFLIGAINCGTITKDGQPVVPGVTTIGYGESIVWHPPTGASGTQTAFSIFAFDGLKTSPIMTTALIDLQYVFTMPRLDVFYELGTLRDRLGPDRAVQFGGIAQDQVSGPVTFTLDNPSDQPLDISDFTTTLGRDFAATVRTATGQPVLLTRGRFTIPAHTTYTIEVQFTARDLGLQEGSITFRTDDPDDQGSPRIIRFQGIAMPSNPPTLTKVDTLTGAWVDQPFTITEEMLSDASDAADPDPGTTIRFRVDSILSGQLTMNGQPVVPGQTLLDPGGSFVWTPPAGAVGTMNAFTISAYDGDLASSSSIPVKVAVLRACHLQGTDNADLRYVRYGWGSDLLTVTASENPLVRPIYTELLHNLGSVEFDGGLGNDTLIIDADLPFAPVFHGGGGMDKLIIRSGRYTLPADLRAETDLFSLEVSDLATVTLAASQQLDSLTIADSARVNLVGNDRGLLCTAGLSLGQRAILDLADHDLLVRNGNYDQISNWIKSARNGGKWDGAFGISSSAAKLNKYKGLAILRNDKGNGQPILATFDGQPATSNDVLVKYTWNGDVNLDGVVDAADYFLVDSGFITQKGGYRNGDLNLDGAVDAADYFLIDSAFIAQSGPGILLAPAATDDLPLTQPDAPQDLVAPESPLAQLFSTTPLLS